MALDAEAWAKQVRTTPLVAWKGAGCRGILLDVDSARSLAPLSPTRTPRFQFKKEQQQEQLKSEQKDHLRQLVMHQTRSYKRMQDKKAQLTKATRELDRLPAWPPNSPDLNLIEVVWSWLVGDIASGSWLTTPEELISAAKRAWANVSVDSFRELCRSYRQRLLAIHSVNGDRHPNFA